MEAQKVFEDESFKNRDYAKLCGITPEALLDMEFHFLELFDFTLNFSDSEFDDYKTRMINFN